MGLGEEMILRVNFTLDNKVKFDLVLLLILFPTLDKFIIMVKSCIGF